MRFTQPHIISQTRKSITRQTAHTKSLTQEGSRKNNLISNLFSRTTINRHSHQGTCTYRTLSRKYLSLTTKCLFKLTTLAEEQRLTETKRRLKMNNLTVNILSNFKIQKSNISITRTTKTRIKTIQ